jgi:predicted aspartyl protease
MMTGIVNAKGEAIVRIVVGNLGTQRLVVDAVIDTGYTGYLTLPPQ